MTYLSTQDIVNAVYSLGLDNPTTDKLIAALAKIPPADVKPVRRARWRYYPAVWECSACKHWEVRGSPWETGRFPERIEFMKFCPGCGAEMEVGR